MRDAPKDSNVVPNIIVIGVTIAHILFLAIVFLKKLLNKDWVVAIIIVVHIIGLIYLCKALFFSLTILIGFTGTG